MFIKQIWTQPLIISLSILLICKVFNHIFTKSQIVSFVQYKLTNKQTCANKIQTATPWNMLLNRNRTPI